MMEIMLCFYFQFSEADRHKLFCGPMFVPALVYDIITILSKHTVIFPIKYQKHMRKCRHFPRKQYFKFKFTGRLTLSIAF